MSDTENSYDPHGDLAGHNESVRGDKAVEADHERARKAAAEKLAAAHDAAVAALSLLSGEAAGYLAQRMQEATYGGGAIPLRVLRTLRELGVQIPPGFLP